MTRAAAKTDKTAQTDQTGGEAGENLPRSSFEPPEHERHWVQRAEELADRFAATARRHDEEATLPRENLKILHEEGFDTALLPQEFGGAGLSNRSFGPIVGAVSRGCPSTACIWLMHVGAAVSLVELSNSKERQEFWASELRAGKRFSNALSEPSSGNRFLNPIQTAEEVEGGWELDGGKRFISGCEIADYFVINVQIDGEPAFFGVESDESVSFNEEWEAMGLRATRSQLLSFDRTLLKRENRCRQLSPEDANPIGVGLPWLSLGIAEAAFEALKDHARGRKIPDTGGSLAEMQWVQFEAADLHMRLEAARLLAAEVLWLADQRSPEVFDRSIEAKYVCNQLAREVADLALRVGGGSGYLKTSPIERHFRNAQAGALMAYSTEVSLSTIGGKIMETGEA